MPDLTPEMIAELQRRLAEAPKGTWSVDAHDEEDGSKSFAVYADHPFKWLFELNDSDDEPEDRILARTISALIVAAVNALPALLALAEEVNRAKEMVSDLEPVAKLHPALAVDVQEHRDAAYKNGWDDGYAEGFGKATSDLLAERRPVADPDMQRVLDVLDASSDPAVNAAGDIIRSLIARPSSEECEAMARRLDKEASFFDREPRGNELLDALREAAALLRKLAPGESGGWQPIASAPKDGTTTLLGCMTDGRLYWALTGYWNGLSWYTLIGGDSGPTHWMPLKELPK